MLHNLWIEFLATCAGCVGALIGWMCFVSYERARDYWSPRFARMRGLSDGTWRQCDVCGYVDDAGNYPDWPDGVCTDCDWM